MWKDLQGFIIHLLFHWMSLSATMTASSLLLYGLDSIHNFIHKDFSSVHCRVNCSSCMFELNFSTQTVITAIGFSCNCIRHFIAERSRILFPPLCKSGVLQHFKNELISLKFFDNSKGSRHAE